MSSNGCRVREASGGGATGEDRQHRQTIGIWCGVCCIAVSVSSDRPDSSYTCGHCPACCRGVRVPLTHHDLRRLQNSQEGAPSSSGLNGLVEWLLPEEIDMSGEPESFVETSRGRRLLVLRHSGAGCVLLTDGGRCSAHAHRPAACAAYPFTLTGSSLTRLPDAPCAVPWPTDEKPWRAVAARVELELREYLLVVARWNRRQRQRRVLRKPRESAERFLEIALRPSLGDEERAGR